MLTTGQQRRAMRELKRRLPPMTSGPTPRQRVLGYALVAAHALYMLALLPSAWYPLWLQVAMFAFVAIPMWRKKGRCWATEKERELLMLPLPSMTIRLVSWLTFGRVTLNKRTQWWVLAAMPVVAFLPRLWVGW